MDLGDGARTAKKRKCNGDDTARLSCELFWIWLATFLWMHGWDGKSAKHRSPHR